MERITKVVTVTTSVSLNNVDAISMIFVVKPEFETITEGTHTHTFLFNVMNRCLHIHIYTILCHVV